MVKHWIFREPSLALGLPGFVVATIAFPLHIGWIGGTWLAFAIYLAAAAVVFTAADVLLRPRWYPGRLSAIPQVLTSLAALAVPAALAFWIGTVAGPVDEAMDEEACAAQGHAEIDTPAAEADDTFDVTPDCA